jgi:hypothetical protein
MYLPKLILERVSSNDSQSPSYMQKYAIRCVQHFVMTLGITTPVGLRKADPKPVIAWVRLMRETEYAAPWTIRQRLVVAL